MSPEEKAEWKKITGVRRWTTQADERLEEETARLTRWNKAAKTCNSLTKEEREKKQSGATDAEDAPTPAVYIYYPFGGIDDRSRTSI